MHQRAIVISFILFAVIIIGMFIYAYLKRAEMEAAQIVLGL